MERGRQPIAGSQWYRMGYRDGSTGKPQFKLKTEKAQSDYARGYEQGRFVFVTPR
jgi:hypothetical protein